MMCALESKLETFVDKLSTSGNVPSFNESIQNVNTQAWQVMALPDGRKAYVQNTQVQSGLPMFQEMQEMSLKSVVSSNTVVTAAGIALSSSVASIFSGLLGGLGGGAAGFLGSPGLIAVIVGWVLAAKVLKSGMGHAFAQGIIYGGVATIAAPYLSQFASGITGGQ